MIKVISAKSLRHVPWLKLEHYFFFSFFDLFRATPVTYGRSQARSCIGAAAAGLNPLRESRDRTHLLMDTSQILNPLSHSGNAWCILFQVKDACLR